MMLKNMIVSLSIFTTVCGFSAMSFSSTQKDTVVVDHQTVPLRQKADIKRANSENTANIETTNVDYDLRYLFGGEKGYLSFDIWSLAPKSTNSKDTSFKFLCAKPVGKNLYLYVYTVNNQNSDIQYANFTISKSKTQNTETGEFEENYFSYNARFINSYGYKQRFIKFCIDDIINLDEDVRCNLSKGFVKYRDGVQSLDINNEFAFNAGGNEDFMYQYFQDDYVRITDGEVSLLLTNPNALGTVSFTEDFYYFFNTDKKIDELQEVQYDYSLVTYEAEMEVNKPKAEDSIANMACYTGLMDGEKGEGKYQTKPRSIKEVSTSRKTNFLAVRETIATQIDRPYFLWWTQKVTYKLETIQNCLDTSNLVGDEYQGFKTFIEGVQKKRLSENKEQYQWMFKITTTERNCEKFWYENDWWYYLTAGLSGEHAYSLSTCHEVKQALILWLKFRTNNIDFEFNVLDIPKDTSSVYLQEVPFETLGDILVDNVIDWWNWFKSVSNNLFKNIVPFTIAFAVILVGILCWPLISAFMKLLSKPIKRLADKPKKKRKR